MAVSFYSQWLDQEVTPSHAPVQLSRSSATLSSTANAPVVRGCLQPYVNEARNSRLAEVLPGERHWTVASKERLDAGFRPREIMMSGDRVLLAGSGEWALFNLDCQLRAAGQAKGAVTIDSRSGLFHVPDNTGTVSARRLGDGGEAYAIPLTLGEEYEPFFIAPREQRLVVVSLEQQLDAHAPEPAEHAMMEVIDLGDPPQADPEGLLSSAACAADLLMKTQELLVAGDSQSLCVALEDTVYRIDFDLRIRSTIQGAFTPIAMSLDDDGWIHLLVESEHGVSLWLMNNDGALAATTVLGEVARGTATPPVLGYDHSVYLLAADRVIAVRPDHTLAWEYRPEGFIAGATVSANNQLIVTSGSEISVFDPMGLSRAIWHLESEELRTPAVISEDGALYFATDQCLYRLEPAPSK